MGKYVFNSSFIDQSRTPKSPSLYHVFRYLVEFLTDSRVIDLPWLKRQLLVRGLIVPARFRNSAKSYAEIWSHEGSPLLTHSQHLKTAVQNQLGTDHSVHLAMRYQSPSIESVLNEIKGKNVKKLVVIPLFPQYASATTGSVQQEVMKHLQHWSVIPELKFISEFASHPQFIEAFAARSRSYSLENYDHVVFSFHGLPESHIKKADCHGTCLKPTCCQTWNTSNHSCYSAQCHATARAIAQTLNLPKNMYSITFQSRLGKDPWLTPFTVDRLDALIQENKKRVLIFSPAFVCDCLETVHEIGIEYKKDFLKKGGQALDLVESLNAHPKWVDAVCEIVLGTTIKEDKKMSPKEEQKDKGDKKMNQEEEALLMEFLESDKDSGNKEVLKSFSHLDNDDFIGIDDFNFSV